MLFLCFSNVAFANSISPGPDGKYRTISHRSGGPPEVASLSLSDDTVVVSDSANLYFLSTVSNKKIDAFDFYLQNGQYPEELIYYTDKDVFIYFRDENRLSGDQAIQYLNDKNIYDEDGRLIDTLLQKGVISMAEFRNAPEFSTLGLGVAVIAGLLGMFIVSRKRKHSLSQ